jgi:peptidoglycan hydrolase-like protein with peptidoglycan-binding domain
MGMRPYVIRQGDYLTKLAHAMGFDADAVWGHADNQALREKRQNHNILQPGDVLHVPEPQPESGPQVSPNTSNRYKARVPTMEIKLKLRDGDGPLANKAYRLRGAGKEQQGTTDGDGLATLRVPLHLREVCLVLEGGREYQLLIGDMDPVDEPSGVRKRLEHLGYLSRSLGDDDGALQDAVRAFQAAQQMTATGEIDQATRDALVSAHGS